MLKTKVLLSGILLTILHTTSNTFGMEITESSSKKQFQFYAQPKDNNANFIYKIRKNGEYDAFKNYNSTPVTDPQHLQGSLNAAKEYASKVGHSAFVCDFYDKYQISSGQINSQLEFFKKIQQFQNGYHIFVLTPSTHQSNVSHLRLIQPIVIPNTNQYEKDEQIDKEDFLNLDPSEVMKDVLLTKHLEKKYKNEQNTNSISRIVGASIGLCGGIIVLIYIIKKYNLSFSSVSALFKNISLSQTTTA